MKIRLAAPIMAAMLLAAGIGPARAETPSAETRTEQFAKLPYWDGLWLTEGDVSTIGGFAEAILEARESGGGNPYLKIMKLNGFDAPWSAEGKARYEAERKVSGHRKADGWGYPMMMNAAAPIQFLITPEEVIVINAYRDVRHIRTDGKGHPPEDDLWPTVWGDSAGHWEGDTLVVDTIMVKNPNDYFHGAPPLSDQAHYVERIRLVDPDTIEDEITIEDPVTLARPWKATLRFHHAQGFDRMIHDTYDNDRTGFDGESSTIEPPKDGE